MDVLGELIGESQGIAALRASVARLVSGRLEGRRLPAVFLRGETGTGKGLLARIMHRASARADGPFVDVNCAAIPETLLESELFGFERGAFTDAKQAKAGLFQTAHGGTIFLDEIGLLPPALQAKLLTVLEAKTVRRLGATRSEAADVWVVSATNEDLSAAIRERRFREDLYHRLAVITLSLPPLRERGDDVVRLAEHFCARAASEYRVPPRAFGPDALAALRAHAWPGNVRELSNVIERAVLLADTPQVTAATLGLTAAPEASTASDPRPTNGSPDERQREVLRRTLNDTDWNITHTAKALGITRHTVRAWIERHGLRRDDGGPAAPVSAAPRAEAERPATAPVALRWEPRRLTALRVRLDVAPETDLAGRRLLETIRGKVFAFGGRIEGVSPSGLFAVFGVDPGEESAAQAAHCAVAIQRVARQTAEAVRLPLPVRFGLHSADLPVGVGGGTTVVDADAVREAWTAVERLLPEVDAGVIVVTLAAGQLMRRRFSLRPLPSGAGYLIAGLWQARPSGTITGGPFVGRREELAFLESRLRSAVQGRGQVVNVVGEAGIGKSRLVLELVRSMPAGLATFLEGRCLPVATTTPFFPLALMIKTACGVDDADPPAVIEDRVRATLAEMGLPDDLAADLIRLLGAQVDRRSPIPPELLKRRLFAAVRTFVVARSHTTPLLLVVEDLHWIDQTSEACLSALVDALPAVPVLLVATYRTGYCPAWLGRSGVSQVTLPPLPPEESLRLVSAMLTASGPAHSILARGEGNPLFLEELVQAAVEHGAVPDRAPASIQDVIAARLAHLGPHPRRVLDAAAVIGREVSRRVLLQVTDAESHAVREESLTQLRQAELLYESPGLGSESGYVFKHALVHEVTYARVPPDDRRRLHLGVLDALERLYPDRRDERIESLAHHAVLGEAGERAVRYLLAAGRKAAAHSATGEAISHFRRGLDLLSSLAEGAERDQLELGLQVSLGLNLEVTRGFAAPEVRHAHSRARELCQRVEGGPLLFGALGGLWFFYYTRAEYAVARDVAEQHRAVVERTGEANRLCASFSALGYTAYRVGALVEARGHLERSLDLYARFPRPAGTSLTPLDLAVSADAGLAPVLWSLGYPEAALEHARSAVERAGRLVERFTSAFSLAWAHNAACRAHVLRREPDQAIEHARRASEIGREHGYPSPVDLAELDVAIARIIQGDAAESVGVLTRGLQKWRESGIECDRSYLLAALAEGLCALGRLEPARAAVDEGLAHVAQFDERFYEAELYRLRGAIVGQREGPTEGALADLARAARIAQAQGAQMLALRVASTRHRLRPDEATRAALAAVMDGFAEGLDTVDLGEARRILDT